VRPAQLVNGSAMAKDGGVSRFRSALALAAAFALVPASGAGATSITAAPPHDPKQGCEAIKRTIADLNAGRLKDPKSAHPSGPTFYSDTFGKVEEGEEAAFLHSLRHSEGKRDRKPIRLYGVFTVQADKHAPIYLAVLERESWHQIRLEEDDMLNVREVRDPRYERDTSYWLVSFRSDDISDFREAGEMFRLMSESNWLRPCRED